VDKGVWKEAVRKNADKKNMGSCDRCKEGIYTMKREDIPSVKRGKGGSERIYKRTAKEGIYLAV